LKTLQLISQLNLAKARLTMAVAADPVSRGDVDDASTILSALIEEIAQVDPPKNAEENPVEHAGAACPGCGDRPARFNIMESILDLPDGSKTIINQFCCANPECGELFSLQMVGKILPKAGPENDINNQRPGKPHIYRPS